MRKLAVISDLHADINHFEAMQLTLLLEVLEEKRVTHLHLAGDSSNKADHTLAIKRFFQERGLPTTFNFGNHEMASLSDEREIEDFPDPDFLNGCGIELSGRRILVGLNGWYDYGFSTIQDVEKIQRMKQTYWYDRYIKRQGSDQEVNHRELERLKKILDELTGYQVILATHFVPKKEFIVYQTGKYAVWNNLNAFLGSPALGDLLDHYDNVTNVVFGHTHRRFEDKIIAGTRYSCRPFGYYFEWRLTKEFVLSNRLVSQYNPMKLRKVLRQHKSEFYEYRDQHLKKEFAQALTLIEY